MNWAPVHRLLAAVRRRLWLEALLQRLRVGLWAGSAVLLVLAALNAAGLPVGWQTAVLAALAVTAAVTLTALTRGPTLADSALHADRRLKTHSLLVTALQLSASPDDRLPPAAAVVHRQACDGSAEWKRHLAGLWHAPPVSGYALTAVPVFVAAVLLALPGAGPSTAVTADNAPGTTGDAGVYRLERGEDLRDLRESIAASGRRGESRDDRGNGTGGGLSPTTEQAGPLGAETRAEIDALQAGTPGMATDDPSGGREAGDARRSPGQSGRSLDESGESLAVETFGIDRQGAPVASPDAKGGDYLADAAAPPNPGQRVRPAAAPPSLGSWTALTAAEVAYARRYLELTEKDHD